MSRLTTHLIKEVQNLDRPSLLELEALIQALLDRDEPQEPQPAGSLNGAGAGPRGCIEHKMIKGHGPYAYLRWRQGKIQKSRYLGKVKQSGESA